MSIFNLHKSGFRLLSLRAVALVQLLVMVVLVLPVCCSESGPEQAKSGVSHIAGTVDGGHDTCPCCPDENNTDDADNCSNCSYCSSYTPLISALSVHYAPLESEHLSLNKVTNLPEGHTPIFVPPQNLA